MKDYTAILVPDVHNPALHRKAWPALLKLIDKKKPDVLAQAGDFGDYHAVSAHPKTYGKERAFYAEVKSNRAVAKELWHAGRRAKRKIALQGNHEESFERYVARNAPQLEGLVPTGRELLALPDDVEWYHYREHAEIGNVLLTHALRSNMSNSATAAMRCAAYGHTHRGGIQYFGDVEGSTYFVMNLGWMGDPVEMQKIYARTVDMTHWQTGFGFMRVTTRGTWAQFIPWVKGQFVLEGEVFR